MPDPALPPRGHSGLRTQRSRAATVTTSNKGNAFAFPLLHICLSDPDAALVEDIGFAAYDLGTSNHNALAVHIIPAAAMAISTAVRSRIPAVL